MGAWPEASGKAAIRRLPEYMVSRISSSPLHPRYPVLLKARSGTLSPAAEGDDLACLLYRELCSKADVWKPQLNLHPWKESRGARRTRLHRRLREAFTDTVHLLSQRMETQQLQALSGLRLHADRKGSEMKCTCCVMSETSKSNFFLVVENAGNGDSYSRMPST